jgi:Mce-associated membrane protein
LALTTDTYRGKLKSEQDTVRKGQPVVNEYWPIASAIESATPDHATMLLFMQGRRGAAPDERYISATVRVAFTENRDKHWLVDDLAVVTKPKPAGSGK